MTLANTLYGFFHTRLNSYRGGLRMIVLTAGARRDLQEFRALPIPVNGHRLGYTATHLRVGAFILSVYSRPTTYTVNP